MIRPPPFARAPFCSRIHRDCSFYLLTTHRPPVTLYSSLTEHETPAPTDRASVKVRRELAEAV